MSDPKLTEASATPRPWHLGVLSILGPLEEAIASVHYPQRSVSRANACMIVTAVNAHADLVAALEELLDDADRRSSGFPPSAEAWYAVRDAARAALDKARGGR